MQHGVILPKTPYGLPPEITLLPQKLKQAGMSFTQQWHNVKCMALIHAQSNMLRYTTHTTQLHTLPFTTTPNTINIPFTALHTTQPIITTYISPHYITPNPRHHILYYISFFF